MAKWRSLRNFQRVYRSSRWFQQRFSPLGRMVMTAWLVSGILGFDTTRNLSFQIFSLLSAVVILAMLFSRFNPGQFRCERILPGMATVGQEFTYTVQVFNASNFPQFNLMLYEQLHENFPGLEELKDFQDEIGKNENWYDRKVGFLRWVRLVRHKIGVDAPIRSIDIIGPQQSIELQLRVTPLRRGYLKFVGSRIAFPDPTGLFRTFHDTKNSDTLLVLPKRYVLPKIKVSGHRSFHQGGIALSSSVGESSEFYGLREYQVGDPMRRIHWRSWARQGKPMVKTYEDEYFVRHALILDTYVQQVDISVFEEAVSVAASVAMEVGTQESMLDLIFVEGTAYQFTSGRSLGDVKSMLEILACVQPEYTTSVDMLTSTVMQHIPLMSSAIFVLVGWDETRQKLINAVKNYGIQITVFLIVENVQTHIGGDYPDVHVLDVGNIQQSLQQVG